MQRVYEYGNHWLHRRAGSRRWYICWCEPGSRRLSRQSTGTANLEEAIRRLIAFVKGDNPSTPHVPVSQPSVPSVNQAIVVAASAPAATLPILEVLAARVDRMKERGSYETVRYTLRGWVDFCAFAKIVYTHELTLPIQEKFIAWRRPSRQHGLPVSNGTINRFLEDLRAACNDAVDRRELVSFPTIELLPQPPPRDRFLMPDEVQRLLAECWAPHLRRFVIFSMHTLQRPAAVTSLRAEQVDFRWNQINFLPAGRVQSNKRRPVVRITDTLRPELEQAIAESNTGHLIEYCGRPVKKVRKSFERACDRAGLVGVSPVILRHTGATLLAADGVPLSEISQLLGHTSTRITEQVYVKRRPEFLAKVAHSLDKLFPTASQVDEETE